MKQISHHANYYPAVLAPDANGGFNVSFPDFPGCVTFGYTIEEAQVKAAEVLSLWIEELASDNKPIPANRKATIITEVKVATPNKNAVAHR